MLPIRTYSVFLAVIAPTALADPPTIAFAFSAKPVWVWRFWQNETPDGYRGKMMETILPLASRPNLIVNTVSFEDPALPDRIERDRSPWPFHQHLCKTSGADWLVSFRVSDERPVFSPFQGDVFSNREAPSAHWPELYWVRYDCKTGQRETARPILSPRREDRYVFETELKTHANRVLQPLFSEAR